MSPDQLRRMALRTGAQLEMGGKTINAGRQRLAVVPKRPEPAAPAAAPAGDPLGAIAEIMQINARVTAQQSETVNTLIGRLAELLPSARPAAQPAAAPRPRVMPILFNVARRRDGAVISLEPIYGEVGDDAELSDLVPAFDERGLMASITPKYN